MGAELFPRGKRRDSDHFRLCLPPAARAFRKGFVWRLGKAFGRAHRRSCQRGGIKREQLVRAEEIGELFRPKPFSRRRKLKKLRRRELPKLFGIGEEQERFFPKRRV